MRKKIFPTSFPVFDSKKFCDLFSLMLQLPSCLPAHNATFEYSRAAASSSSSSIQLANKNGCDRSRFIYALSWLIAAAVKKQFV
jgi:hypothetical protein